MGFRFKVGSIKFTVDKNKMQSGFDGIQILSELNSNSQRI